MSNNLNKCVRTAAEIIQSFNKVRSEKDEAIDKVKKLEAQYMEADAKLRLVKQENEELRMKIRGRDHELRHAYDGRDIAMRQRDEARRIAETLLKIIKKSYSTIEHKKNYYISECFIDFICNEFGIDIDKPLPWKK